MGAFVSQFVVELLDRAHELRSYGADSAAATCETVANDLQAQFAEWWTTAIPIREAAEASGYSEDHLRELAREGRIGSDGGIRRCDLPRRPNRTPASAVDDLVQAVRG